MLPRVISSCMFPDTELFLVFSPQVGPDMLVSGFLQPIPDLTPSIPSLSEISKIDPSINPYESTIISFYKTWDPYGSFSNFSPHPIQMPDEGGDYSTWTSVEHYYQVMCFVFPEKSIQSVCSPIPFFFIL